MTVNEVLVALELDRAVAADVPVPVARVRVVEYVHGKVHGTVAQLRILQDHLVHRPLGELPIELARTDEMVSIEISLADGEHIERQYNAY